MADARLCTRPRWDLRWDLHRVRCTETGTSREEEGTSEGGWGRDFCSGW